jgi:CheY-like chemotaxis protein
MSVVGPRLVLVVEDEPLLRSVVVQAFRQAGWDVLEASTGESAVAILGDGRAIDVLFTDIQLPGCVSGWDIAATGRAENPELSVVYASGDPADYSRMVASSTFIHKPYDAESVIEVCRRFV